MTRKGFQIAASTLVVMILGLVVVSGGIYLVAKIQTDAIDTTNELTAEHRTKLRDILQRGQLLAVWPAYDEVRPGKDVVFGIALENRLDAQHDFLLTHNVLNATGDAADTNNWGFAYTPTVQLGKNERQWLAFAITPDINAPLGEYTVIITAMYDTGEVYDSQQFFTINVR